MFNALIPPYLIVFLEVLKALCENFGEDYKPFYDLDYFAVI